MNPQVLEIIGILLLAVIAYVIARSRKRDKPDRRMPDRRMPDRRDREIWDEVEGRVLSLEVRGDAVFVAYEFLALGETQHAQHRFDLEIREPFQLGSREADLAHALALYVRAYPVGSPARVRFNPKRVNESVLARRRASPVPSPAKHVESPVQPV